MDGSGCSHVRYHWHVCATVKFRCFVHVDVRVVALSVSRRAARFIFLFESRHHDDGSFCFFVAFLHVMAWCPLHLWCVRVKSL